MCSVPNATSAVEAMGSMILAVLEANSQFRYLLIAMESTYFYSVHVVNYLSISDRAKPYGVKVFCLNPKTITNYKKSFTGLGKNDGIDAFIVADYVRPEESTPRPGAGTSILILPCSALQDSAGTSAKRLPGRKTMS